MGGVWDWVEPRRAGCPGRSSGVYGCCAGQMGAWEAKEAWGMGLGCGSRLLSPFSKKFLWEELELVREEVTFIYQKLREFREAWKGCGATLLPLFTDSLFPNRGPGG